MMIYPLQLALDELTLQDIINIDSTLDENGSKKWTFEEERSRKIEAKLNFAISANLESKEWNALSPLAQFFAKSHTNSDPEH